MNPPQVWDEELWLPQTWGIKERRVHLKGDMEEGRKNEEELIEEESDREKIRKWLLKNTEIIKGCNSFKRW